MNFACEKKDGNRVPRIPLGRLDILRSFIQNGEYSHPQPKDKDKHKHSHRGNDFNDKKQRDNREHIKKVKENFCE